MSAECPLSYIKSIQCPGPIKVSRNVYICPKGDSICQGRLDGRTFEQTPKRETPPDEVFKFIYREP